MQTTVRLLLLSLFAAVGAALAVGFALQTEPLDRSEHVHVAKPVTADDARLETTIPANDVVVETPPLPARPPLPIQTTPVTSPLMRPYPATEARYESLVASQFELVQEKLERLQDAAKHRQEMLNKTLSNLEQSQQRTEAAQQAAASSQAKQAERSAEKNDSPEPATQFTQMPNVEPTPATNAIPAQTPVTDAVVAQPQVHREGEGDNGLTVNVQDSELREVLELLSQAGNLNILTSKSVTGRVTASLSGVDVMTALQAILRATGYVARAEGNFIYVGSPEDLQQMQNADDSIQTKIYRPNYVTAAELETLVTPLLTPQIGQARVSVGTVAKTTPAQVGIASDGDEAGGDSYSGGDVLLVRDYSAVLTQIDSIISEVDVRPPQVAIEAMILSVRLDDQHQLGVNFESLRDRGNIRVASGSPLADLATLDFTNGGLKFGFLDASLGMFIDALETVGDTNVIASPRLMVMNKQRAEIQIGSELGYVSTTVTENAATQAIEFLQVGTQLRLRPFITRDGMIRMEVHPELSTGNVRVEQGFTLPDKEVTQVTTNIMCPDCSTVIIGGLIREQLTKNTNQIPWFGNLPVLGPAFRQKVEGTDRHEIIVLITPKIVCEPEMCQEGAQAADEFKQRHGVYADKMSPYSKRFMGRKYYRLAQEAWRTGNQQRALRFVNLAIHFDPQNRMSVNLRDDILRGHPSRVVQTSAIEEETHVHGVRQPKMILEGHTDASVHVAQPRTHNINDVDGGPPPVIIAPLPSSRVIETPIVQPNSIRVP